MNGLAPSTSLARAPTIDEYKRAVKGIELTKFEPPEDEMATACGTSGVAFRGGGGTVELRISADD